MVHFLWKVGDWALHLRVRACSSFWIAKLFEFSASRIVDHSKGVYAHDSWEDVFSSYNGSFRKLLAGHLLRDDSRLGEDVFGQ